MEVSISHGGGRWSRDIDVTTSSIDFMGRVYFLTFPMSAKKKERNGETERERDAERKRDRGIGNRRQR
jgi:hypothetical protein